MQVAIPSLHISLGIFQKLFDMFENKCQEFDTKLALNLTNIPSSSLAYKNYVANLAEIQAKEEAISTHLEEIKCYQDIITWLSVTDEEDECCMTEEDGVVDDLRLQVSQLMNTVDILLC